MPFDITPALPANAHAEPYAAAIVVISATLSWARAHDEAMTNEEAQHLDLFTYLLTRLVNNPFDNIRA